MDENRSKSRHSAHEMKIFEKVKASRILSELNHVQISKLTVKEIGKLLSFAISSPAYPETRRSGTKVHYSSKLLNLILLMHQLNMNQ